MDHFAGSPFFFFLWHVALPKLTDYSCWLIERSLEYARESHWYCIDLNGDLKVLK